MRAIPFALLYCTLITCCWWLIPHPLVAIVVALVPFAITGVLRFPFLVVLLFVIFSFCRIHEAYPFLSPLKLPKLLALAALFAMAWHLIITGAIRPYWSNSLTATSSFFIAVITGLFFATNKGVAFTTFTDSYVKIIIMTFAIAWLTRTEKDFSLCLHAMPLAGMAVGVVALWNKANSIGLVEGTRVTVGRDIGSILGDPNDLALVLMFPISFAAALALNRQLSLASRSLGAISCIVLFSAVLATQSRGGLLGILAVFGIMAYRRMRSKILFFSVGAIAAAGLFAVAGISGRSSGGAGEAGIDASAMGRLYAWEAAIGMANANPLSGVGLKNFYSNYYFYSPHWDGLNHAVHSTWFGVLAEAGYLGLIIFLAMIFTLFKSAGQSITLAKSKNCSPIIQATAEANFAAIASICVSGTFLTQGFTWPIYIVCSLIIALQYFHKNS